MYTHVHIHVYMYIYIYIYIYICMCIYPYVCVHVCVCIYIYIHTRNASAALNGQARSGADGIFRWIAGQRLTEVRSLGRGPVGFWLGFVHPVRNPRFASFRTQPFENLGAAVKLPIKKGFWATQPLEQILVAEFLLCELGVVSQAQTTLAQPRIRIRMRIREGVFIHSSTQVFAGT